jgi:hypothetical protein
MAPGVPLSYIRENLRPKSDAVDRRTVAAKSHLLLSPAIDEIEYRSWKTPARNRPEVTGSVNALQARSDARGHFSRSHAGRVSSG